MRLQYRNILLLDQNYAPIQAISWRKGMGLLYGRKIVEVVRFYDDTNSEYEPAVLRLLYRSFPNNRYRYRTRFHRRQIMMRDRYTCAYCGKTGQSDLTIDHVLPRSRGGKSSYNNCVAACFSCNQRKDAMTPEEAGMRLLFNPTAPLRGIIVSTANMPNEWREHI